MNSSSFTNEDRLFMARAIELSQQGWPAPNPHVGCVIARSGQIIAEGWHEHAGGPHAEAMALAATGDKAEGSDVYVTLEPCSHFGRTPPCSAALIQAKVKRVVYAVADPNPKASGGGKALAEAGIEVQAGLFQVEAAAANQWWLASQLLGRPVVILKAAITRDGFMARPDGTSKWITSPESRLEGHNLRAEMGAVLVGWRTVQFDNPELTARIPGVVNQPRAVILDPQGRLSGQEKALGREGALWLAGTGRGVHNAKELPLINDRFDVAALLGFLRTEGVMGVLVEGGAGVLGSFLESGVWDELHVFVGQGEFGQGLAAPVDLLNLALDEQIGDDVIRVERRATPGQDRHIKVMKWPGPMGTIEEWLGSIPNS